MSRLSARDDAQRGRSFLAHFGFIHKNRFLHGATGTQPPCFPPSPPLYLLEAKPLTLSNGHPKLLFQLRPSPIRMQDQGIETGAGGREAVRVGAHAAPPDHVEQLDLDDQVRSPHGRDAVAARDESQQLALVAWLGALEGGPEPLRLGFLVGSSAGGPALVDGHGAQGVDVERFVGSPDQELDLFWSEQRERVAAADGEEAAFEWLVLAADCGVKEIVDVQFDELAAVGVGHWDFVTTGAKRYLQRTMIRAS